MLYIRHKNYLKISSLILSERKMSETKPTAEVYYNTIDEAYRKSQEDWILRQQRMYEHALKTACKIIENPDDWSPNTPNSFHKMIINLDQFMGRASEAILYLKEKYTFIKFSVSQLTNGKDVLGASISKII